MCPHFSLPGGLGEVDGFRVFRDVCTSWVLSVSRACPALCSSCPFDTKSGIGVAEGLHRERKERSCRLPVRTGSENGGLW